MKATSQADVRQWEMLPRTVYVLPLRVEPGKHDLTIDFPGISGLRQTWIGIDVPPAGEVAHYIRPLRWGNYLHEWPPVIPGRYDDDRQTARMSP